MPVIGCLNLVLGLANIAFASYFYIEKKPIWILNFVIGVIISIIGVIELFHNI